MSANRKPSNDLQARKEEAKAGRPRFGFVQSLERGLAVIKSFGAENPSERSPMLRRQQALIDLRRADFF